MKGMKAETLGCGLQNAELAIGRQRRHWKIATRDVHPSQVPEAKAVIIGGDNEIEQLVGAGDIEGALRAVDSVTNKLRYGGFTAPKPEQHQSEIWEKELKACEWQRDFDALFDDARGLLKKGEKITYLDWWTIEVDGVPHLHEELRRRTGARTPVITRAEVEKIAEGDLVIREMLRRSDAHRKDGSKAS